MAIFKIPTTLETLNYEVDVELDGVEFRLRLKFSQRDQAWYLTFLDTNDTVLRAGLRIVSDWDIIRLWQDTDRPGETSFTTSGEGSAMIPINIGDPIQVPDSTQLGKDVILTYSGES